MTYFKGLNLTRLAQISVPENLRTLRRLLPLVTQRTPCFQHSVFLCVLCGKSLLV